MANLKVQGRDAGAGGSYKDEERLRNDGVFGDRVNTTGDELYGRDKGERRIKNDSVNE